MLAQNMTVFFVGVGNEVKEGLLEVLQKSFSDIFLDVLEKDSDNLLDRQ